MVVLDIYVCCISYTNKVCADGFFLAIEAKDLGWNDAALSELQRAIDINPDYAIAHFNLAAMYLEQKPPAKALARRHYDKALSLGAEKDEVLERKLAAQ